MKYVAFGLVALLAMSGTAQSQEQNLIRYSLDNGLDVVLVPDHRVPKVVVDISYRVGAMNEPPGRSGFAHLFEHLMFSGTPAYPNIDVAYGAVGVSINAYTYDDRTTYYAEGMASALPMMLSLEADRMANQGAAITEDDLDIQRDVVLNEMRQNTLDYVTGTAWQAILTALYPASHPYSRAVIGSIPDLEAATIEDVHGFFDTFYVPNNATLVVIGDFDADAARTMIADTFGRIPRGADVPRPEPTDIVPARTRIVLEDRVPTPTLMLGWAVAPLQDDDLPPLRIVLELLDNPDYGVLRQALVDTGLASSTSVTLEPGYLGSRFVISINTAEGADPAVVEAAARTALSNFLASVVTDADIARERRKIILMDRSANEKLLQLADNILIFTEVKNSPQYAIDDDPIIAAATPDGVMAAARQQLDPAGMTVVLINPGDRGTYPDVLTASSGTSEPFAGAARAPVDIPALPAGDLVPAEAPPVETATLSNGIRVVHYPIPIAALTYVAAVSPAGTLAAPAGKEGIIELSSAMGPRGAGALSPSDFGRAVKDLGAEIGAKADDMATAITLAAPAETFDAAVALFADALLRPSFDAHEWDVLKAATLEELALREGNLDDVATRYGEFALFPRQPGEAAIDRSIASVKAVELAEARETYWYIFTPASITFYSVGSMPLADITAALEREFGGWTSAVAPLTSPVRSAAVFPATTKVLLVPEPGASQASIYVAAPAPGFDDPARSEAEAVFNLLNYDFISRINSVIREQKGYTYGTDGRLLGAVRTGSVLTVEALVESGTVGPALEEIVKGFGSLVSDPVRPDELERTVVSNYAAIAETAETAQGLFDELWEQLGMASTLEEMHEVRLGITALELSSVQRQAEAMAAIDRALIVVVGDPDVVRPQLDALGFPVDVVERNL